MKTCYAACFYEPKELKTNIAVPKTIYDEGRTRINKRYSGNLL